MSELKRNLLIGVCAASAAIALPLAGDAKNSAKNATEAWGGGSSLIAPYMRQAMDCYGLPEPLIVRGPPVQWQSISPFNYTGGKAQNCQTTHINTSAILWYDSASSGVGIANFFSHDPKSDYTNGYGDTNPNKSGEQDMPYVSFAMSDAGLGTTEVGIYNNGNDNNGPNNACSTPYQTICVVAPGETPSPPKTFANPASTYGALVQFPVAVDPVAFAYDPVYKKIADGQGNVTAYKFNVQFEHQDNSGGLHLDATTYCKIFNGQITDWSNPALTALNGGTSLQDPQDIADNGAWGGGNPAPSIQLVGRSDSSGTTSIFTRHLANVCANLTGNQYADGTTTLPSGLIGGNYDGNTVTGEVLGKFTVAKGSGLVAKYVSFNAGNPVGNGQTVQWGRLGYLGADYVLPASTINNQNAYGLNSADLKNSSGKFEPADGAHALIAFGSVQPPQSDSRGHYDLSSCSGSSDKCRSHAYDWVEPISKTSPLANPTPSTSYPVVGTTNVLAYTCYSNAKVGSVMTGFFGWYLKSKTIQDPALGVLALNGLAALPKQWTTAIAESFITGKDNLGLNIEAAGSDHCSGVTGG
ncbi:MAG: substrate-binding domain-containing protein [Alphaproteobacteria bacterium]|nr:substrate-binding domain-containing protein [Alphaproteobacteria bacterium]MBV9062030.1 substrate-binding domain-containing protein [Alphaproteobacteria bacterium]